MSKLSGTPAPVQSTTADRLNAMLAYPRAHGGRSSLPNIPAIVCADGATLSVQASHCHYCTPRENGGPYLSVEVGFPSVAPPDSWRQYFDGNWEKDDRTGSVYGYVPVDLVAEFIDAHGGFAEGADQ